MGRLGAAHRVRPVERLDPVGDGEPGHRHPARRGDVAHPAVEFSRNPLYVGLVALDVAIALLVPSFWALVFVPLGAVALEWGAVRPEERYLSEKFGPEYDDYRARVRRWL